MFSQLATDESSEQESNGIMNVLIQQVWRSSLGKKYIMAVTGLGLFAFVIGHLLGNLQVFGSPDLINSYAYFLKSKPGLLWGARVGLLICVGLHIAAAATLYLMNKAARPDVYEGVKKPYAASVASRSMPISGLVILSFIIYHLLHFTAAIPWINGTGVDFSKLTTRLPNGVEVHDAYAMMIRGFQVWWVVLFYLIAQGLLYLHLGHGLASLFQSLGWRNRVWWPRVQCFAQIVSVLIFLGYASIPIGILGFGVGKTYLQERTNGMSTVTESVQGVEQDS
jgi:succinate dehydrogenase / fumarate reductase cytochrome b subunit